MRRFLKGRRLAMVLTLVALGGAGVALAVPAYAETQDVYGTTFVDGAGALTDDWGDNANELGHSLCYGCADSRTDLVTLWQAVLYVDGYLTNTDVDGQFGPKTRDATKAWQSYRGLDSDGYVGDDTWSKADNFLVWDTYGGFVTYSGRYGDVELERGTGYKGEGAYLLSAARRGSTWVFFESSRAATNSRIEFRKRTYTPYL
ncbi:hypothetical protein GCM10009682_38390 [Luedemannella flava]|uniref:Peptidoglycan binding-like domain-containing protein n=1 Tax=Luedemannella flava TaxID=349316 RepID=A0ABP4YEB4_9ACTN